MSNLTIAICTFNRAASGYLERSVRSVLAQTYRDMEVVVYDDGSTDNTESVIREMMKHDSRVRYVKNPVRLGLFGNLNKAFSECGSEFLILFHDDDVMLPDMAETQLQVMDEHPNAIVCGQHVCSGYYIDENGNDLRNHREWETGEPLVFRRNELILRTLEDGENLFCCPAMMYRMEFINRENLRFIEEAGVAADWLMWLQLNQTGHELVCLRRPLVRYRIHGASTTNVTKAQSWLRSLAYVEKWCIENGYGPGTRQFRDNMIKDAFDYASAAVASSSDPQGILNELYRIVCDDIHWDVSDDLSKSLAKVVLGAAMRNCGLGKQYWRTRQAARSVFGKLPGTGREISWFYKRLFKTKPSTGD